VRTGWLPAGGFGPKSTGGGGAGSESARQPRSRDVPHVLNMAPGVPVVIVSGSYDEELEANAVHQGVQEYLVKGAFDVKQLAHAVRFAIERQGC